LREVQDDERGAHELSCGVSALQGVGKEPSTQSFASKFVVDGKSSEKPGWDREAGTSFLGRFG
jgi:hypothetical protein